jgi:hypothetical protein
MKSKNQPEVSVSEERETSIGVKATHFGHAS